MRGSFALATGTTRDCSVFSTHMKTLTISGQVVWIPTHCFQPNGKRVCTRRRTGCEKYDTLVHPGWFSAGVPVRNTKTGHRNEDLILAEIRLITSLVFWPRSDGDFLLLRVGDRALASRIQALLLQAAGRAMCACVFYKSYPSTLVCILSLFRHQPFVARRACECCARETA